jgi:hypothetical protein
MALSRESRFDKGRKLLHELSELERSGMTLHAHPSVIATSQCHQKMAKTENLKAAYNP